MNLRFTIFLVDVVLSIQIRIQVPNKRPSLHEVASTNFRCLFPLFFSALCPPLSLAMPYCPRIARSVQNSRSCFQSHARLWVCTLRLYFAPVLSDSKYSTAAIYFANGSFAEVAQIEGSPEYKRFMRNDAPSSARKSLCDRLPPSLQQVTLGLCSKPPDITSTLSLLRALKYSIESYLGTTFCFVDVVVPDLRQTYQISVIETTIRAIHLRQTLETLNAGKLALLANRVSKESGSDAAEQVVLAIDYSRSGLNTMIFCDDNGIIDALRQVYSPHLGAENPLPGNLKGVKTALKKFIQPPFGTSPMGQKLPDHIDRLVLYGDRCSDKQFSGMLVEILGKDLVEKSYLSNPVFVSADGMALASYEHMDDIDFNIKPAFGCRWRSRLYDEPRNEL